MRISRDNKQKAKKIIGDGYKEKYFSNWTL